MSSERPVFSEALRVEDQGSSPLFTGPFKDILGGRWLGRPWSGMATGTSVDPLLNTTICLSNHPISFLSSSHINFILPGHDFFIPLYQRISEL
jgi:hypothetical protein